MRILNETIGGVPIGTLLIGMAIVLAIVWLWSVSGVLPPSCGGRRSSEDANGVDRIGSHIWSTI
jgi:hypothetical protein